MTNLRLTLGALLCCALMASPAFADEDAGAGVPADATATGDAGSTDVVDPPSDTTGTGGSYTVNPCWDEKCTAEIDACKKSAGCDALAKCVKGGKSSNTCGQELQTTKADGDLFVAIANCGYKACNDPNAGSCGSPGKNGAANRCGQFDDNWKCNCDDACTQYNDCCADKDSVCGGGGGGGGGGGDTGTCKDQCGNFLGQDVCNCDSECSQYDDCCPDYKDLCETCTPQCDGKQCGPDGCGGNCGACPSGTTCNAGAGKCESGSTGGTDAGGTGDSTSGGTTDTTGGDSSTGGNGATTGGSTTSSSSSGCTAAPSSNGAAGLLLVLGLVFGLVVTRRRFA